MCALEGRRVLLTGASGFIGTNLVDLLEYEGAEVCNADIAAPLRPDQARVWKQADVMEPAKLADLFATFDPHVVVHLAARTDTLSTELDGYRMNHVGTRNVVDAIPSAPSAERFVFVSTQFVVRPGVPFVSETDFDPHTAYGQSKVIAEQDIRENPPDVTWVIVRPTNVWGPWHLRYQREFWRVVGRGLYLHPAQPDPIRSYAYVGSVCAQILAVLTVESGRVHERALYVGDEPIRQSLWVDAFSVALRGRRARRVPGGLVAALGRVGDLAQRAHLPSPITSERYASMTSDYPTPMYRTAGALGELHSVRLDVGVRQTTEWLQDGTSADVADWLMSPEALEGPPMTDHRFRRRLATTRLAPLIALGPRLAHVGRHNAHSLAASARWLVQSKEHTNLTYDLEELNQDQLAWFVAEVAGIPVGTARSYIREIESDEELRSHIRRETGRAARKRLADHTARYGRRVGWYAIVRALEPEHVVETGTDKGLGSCVLAAALLRNRHGRLTTIDINPESGYLIQPPYASVVDRRISDSVQALTGLGVEVDLFLHDSDHSPEYEGKEFAAVTPHLSRRAVVMSDNAHVTNQLSSWAERQGWKFQFFAEKPAHHWYPGDGIGVALRPGPTSAG
jgi:nucleoside-diphosphate-sugar epimerase